VISALRAALGLTSVRVCMALSGAFGLVLGALPLLAVHGVESALALGVVVPSLAAIVGARAALRERALGLADPFTLAGRAVSAGLLVVALPVIVLALNALRVRNCTPLEGFAFIVVGPIAGVLLASLVGACAGALPIRPSRATALAVLIPLFEIGRALHGLYDSPAVFAYGHFFGYFPGALYDELVPMPPPLLTLRAISAAFGVGLLCTLGALYDRSRCQIAILPEQGKKRLLVVGLGLLGAALVGVAKGEALGHRTSVAHIAELLGGHELGKRCELIVPRELRRARRTRLAEDCDFRVAELERWFGVTQPGRVRVFLFRSPQEKRQLMGAAQTNIAKPWRREIYLQDDAWPHPVMPHELAHIVAGNTGRGPLRISGGWFGLYPDFALIEGVAVAAAWPASSPAGLTPHQWTRAMYELGIAPRLRAVFGSRFLTQQHRLAYMISGSLLRFVADQHGSAALRRIYQSGDIEQALGIPLQTLEARFRAYIMAVPLPEAARALAKQRFAGSSILSSVCPHAKAQLRAELDGQLMADDTAEAQQTCERLLAIDPAEAGVRVTLVAILARRGKPDAAALELGKLEGPPAAAPPLIAAARQALGDEAWRNRRFDEAERVYDELLGWPNDRDALRQLQVRRLAFSGSARQRDLIFSLLVGEPGVATDPVVAVHLARELRIERTDGLPQYLEARQLFARERFAESCELLSQARRLSLPTRELALEATRLLATCHFANGAFDASAALWKELGAAPDQLGVQAEAQDWLARIDTPWR
jgi:tetratricopeptide (TPR) repeat protein